MNGGCRAPWPPTRIVLARTLFPERAPAGEALLDRALHAMWLRRPGRRGDDIGFADAVAAQIAAWTARDASDIRAAAQRAAGPAFAGGDPADAATALALACVAAQRTLGWLAHPPQRVAARKLLQGRLVELDTGEGKTLAAALAACVSATAGVPTHVVTVNDYLAERDAQTMRPLYEFFGLGVGQVHGGIAQDRRAAAYAQPVTYCTNKELVFDYLRDGIAARGVHSQAQHALQRLHRTRSGDDGLRLRGLHFAIVDEADSVLIDEARTPMVLASARDADSTEGFYRELLDAAESLRPGRDYLCLDAQRRIELTEAGRVRIAQLAAGALEVASEASADVWAIEWAREQMTTHALRAIHLLQRDRHYVVHDGKVVIVDESTGRRLPDRSWEQGLHQLVEAKEGCVLTGTNRTLARLTSQGFFSRYLCLAGMSGTVREVAHEAAAEYRMRTERVEPNLACRRRELPSLLWPDLSAKHAAVVREVRERLALGQAVLVGTASVRASHAVGAALSEAGIAHRVLNALQDQHEAELVAEAGRRGAVTVATDMAGRGTDIVLDRAVVEAGGLHVVLTEWHESARVDRQLFGRCARQGDPGTCRAIVSLGDDLVQAHAPREARWVASLWEGGPSPAWAVRVLRRVVQARAERAAARGRALTIRNERELRTLLAFSGVGE